MPGPTQNKDLPTKKIVANKATERQTAMTEEQLRLECLRLAHTHGLPVTEVLAKAKSYEEFVAGKPAAKQDSPEKVQSPKRKKDGNPSLFD